MKILHEYAEAKAGGQVSLSVETKTDDDTGETTRNIFAIFARFDSRTGEALEPEKVHISRGQIKAYRDELAAQRASLQELVADVQELAGN